MNERETTVQEQLCTTLWSPGFAHVLGIISKKYDALAHDATHNLNASEKHHYGTVIQISLLTAIVADIFKLAAETPPESIRTKMSMKE